MATPKISIIIPVYNAEEYLLETVNSVFSQTFSDYELILVDDGSVDRSPAMCDQFAQEDPRVRVIHQKNRGVAGARNAGLDAAAGEYVTFLDADDLWDEKFLEVMLREAANSDLPTCRLMKFSDTTDARPDPEYLCDMSLWCWPIMNSYFISCVRCIYQRKQIEKLSLDFTPGRKTGEDVEFAYKYMLLCDSVSFVDEAVHYYRQVNTSTMHQRDERHFDAVEAMKSVEQFAFEHCTDEQAIQISNALRYGTCPKILEFATVTLLTAGKSVNEVRRYLRDKGYDTMLTEATRVEQHYESRFMALWGKSPQMCLRYYALRKWGGGVLRKLRLRK